MNVSDEWNRDQINSRPTARRKIAAEGQRLSTIAWEKAMRRERRIDGAKIWGLSLGILTTVSFAVWMTYDVLRTARERQALETQTIILGQQWGCTAHHDHCYTRDGRACLAGGESWERR